jgi:hypothetical protein
MPDLAILIFNVKTATDFHKKEISSHFIATNLKVIADMCKTTTHSMRIQPASPLACQLLAAQAPSHDMAAVRRRVVGEM